MKDLYILRDRYTLNNNLVFKDTKKIPFFMTERTIKFQMFSNFDKLLDSSKFTYGGNHGELAININFDKSLKEDGYILKVNKNKEVTIDAQNERAIRYAIDTLNKITYKNNQDLVIPITVINDYPSFKLRGIIEGFYGTPWSHENRLDVIDFMDKYRLNIFMYAPKDDLYHRNKWRELYPEKELSQLITYKNKCDEKAIEFYYCISPGKDFNYSDDNDFQLLFRKVDQVIDNGVYNFAILMDDIDYKLSEENKKIFKRPGIAHAYVLNKINDYIKEHTLNYDLVMCPTEYHQPWDSVYRTDLRLKLATNIKVVHTGDRVCAEVIDEQHAKDIKEIYKHEILLWENYPVNDFWKSRIFLGPIINRTSHLSKYFESMVSNPMNQWHASKISLVTIAHYMWNSCKYDPEKSLELGIKEVVGDEHYEDMHTFVRANAACTLTNDDLFKHENWVNQGEVDQIRNYYKKLKTSSKRLLKTNYPIIGEIKPWLKRAVNEANIVEKILNKTITKEEIIKLYEKPVILGTEILNLLIKKEKLLSDEEYDEHIKPLLGNLWWQVWEEKL
ncbi:MAG: beta-N-acetylglucosaminidase domain-containing protein [Acholeplasmataceae bacterium]|jgi:hyaluronoglucosaminidase